MHAFIAQGALALLTYSSTANAQIGADAILTAMPMERITPATLSTVVAASTPTAELKAAAFDPNNYDPNDCTNPEPYLSMECMRGINQEKNADIIPCDVAADCKCAERLGEGSTPFGYTETCSGSDSVPSSCLCVALTEQASNDIMQPLFGIGETTCMVVNEAANIEAKTLKLAGKVTKQKEVKWAGKIFNIGLNVFAKGSKIGNCKNAGCPGHEFVAIDPEDLEAELGLLDVCGA